MKHWRDSAEYFHQFLCSKRISCGSRRQGTENRQYFGGDTQSERHSPPTKGSGDFMNNPGCDLSRQNFRIQRPCMYARQRARSKACWLYARVERTRRKNDKNFRVAHQYARRERQVRQLTASSLILKHHLGQPTGLIFGTRANSHLRTAALEKI